MNGKLILTFVKHCTDVMDQCWAIYQIYHKKLAGADGTVFKFAGIDGYPQTNFVRVTIEADGFPSPSPLPADGTIEDELTKAFGLKPEDTAYKTSPPPPLPFHFAGNSGHVETLVGADGTLREYVSVENYEHFLKMVLNWAVMDCVRRGCIPPQN